MELELDIDHDKSRDTIDGREAPSVLYVLAAIAELIGLLCILLIAVWDEQWMGGFAWDGSDKEFNWHPLLVVTGFIFINGNSLIVYRVLRSIPKFTVKLIHAALQGISFIVAVVGIIAVFQNNDFENNPDMYSLHSWIGMSTAILFGLQYLIGFMAFLFPKFGDNVRKIYLQLHVFFGIVILVMSVAAAMTGLTEKMLFMSGQYDWSKFVPPGNVANACGLMLISFVIIIGYIVYNPAYKRREMYQLISN